MDEGGLHVVPPFVEYDSSVRSSFNPNRPSDHASTISLVASIPVGAPFAMSTLGMAARSLRAPAFPSSMQRPLSASTRKHMSFIVTTSRGDVQVCPPSNDRTIVCAPTFDVSEKWVKNA